METSGRGQAVAAKGVAAAKSGNDNYAFSSGSTRHSDRMLKSSNGANDGYDDEDEDNEDDDDDNTGVVNYNNLPSYAACSGNAKAAVKNSSRELYAGVDSSTGGAYVRSTGAHNIEVEAYGSASAGVRGDVVWARDGSNVAEAKLGGAGGRY